MSETAGEKSAPQPGLEDLLKDFWATRPQRPREGRVFAGVAAGIGQRYGIDPVIVRVLLIVTTFFGGTGVLFYLLGWLFLAKEGDEASPIEGLVHHGRSSTSSLFVLLLLLALIPAAGFLFHGYISIVISAAALLAGLYLLHRNRAEYRPSIQRNRPNTSAPTVTADRVVTDTVDSVAAEQRVTPPTWDPLGTAPFGWDLPEPAPEPMPLPTRRHKPRVALATLGVMLVACTVVVVVFGHSVWFTPAHVVGIALAIVGLGLIAGSFVRSGRSLVVLALLLSLVGVGLTVAHIGRWNGIGDEIHTPTSVNQVLPEYQRSLGGIRLDLTQLPNSGTVNTNIDVGAGEVHVAVPADADVQVVCNADLGDVSCLGQRNSGTSVHEQFSQAGGNGTNNLKIVLNASVGTGEVEVSRG